MKRLLNNRRMTLVILLLIAAVVRLYGLASQSLSIDECLEVELASQSIHGIVNASNSFPPLYHLLLKGWLTLDHGQTAVRNFSFVVGVLSLFAFWKLACEATNEKTAVVALGLAVVSPFHVYHSQEGRGFGLILLLAILAMLYGLRLVRQVNTRFSWDSIAFVGISLAGMYTNYFFAAVLIAISLGSIVVKGLGPARRQFMPFVLVVGVLAGPLFFLLPDDLQYQRDRREPNPASISAIGHAFFSYESGYALGPSRSDLHHMTASEAVMDALPWLATLAPIVVCLLLLGYLYFVERKEVHFWIIALFVPFAAVIALCQLLGVPYNTRFVIGCWVPYCLLMATGVTALLPKPRMVVCLILLMVYTTALFNRHHVDEYQNEDMKAVAQFLDTADPLPVFVCAGCMDGSIRQYVQDPDRVIRLEDPSFADGSEDEALRMLSESQRSFWFVYCRPFHGDPDGKILDWIERHGGEQPLARAAGVSVYRCNRSTGQAVAFEQPVVDDSK